MNSLHSGLYISPTVRESFRAARVSRAAPNAVAVAEILRLTHRKYRAGKLEPRIGALVLIAPSENAEPLEARVRRVVQPDEPGMKGLGFTTLHEDVEVGTLASEPLLSLIVPAARPDPPELASALSDAALRYAHSTNWVHGLAETAKSMTHIDVSSLTVKTSLGFSMIVLGTAP